MTEEELKLHLSWAEAAIQDRHNAEVLRRQAETKRIRAMTHLTRDERNRLITKVYA